MTQAECELVLPDKFPFPYEKPYDIQVDFMKALYKTLELKKVGIFESPTGTVNYLFAFFENNMKIWILKK